jgi:hypothetical protein
MSNAALFNSTGGAAYAELDFAGKPAVYVGLQLYRTAAQTAAQTGFAGGKQLLMDGDLGERELFTISATGEIAAAGDYDLAAGTFTSDTWHTLEMLWEPTVTPAQVVFDGAVSVDNYVATPAENVVDVLIGQVSAFAETGAGIYVGHVWIGTTAGAHDVLQEDWTGGTFGNWTTTHGTVSVVSAPVAPPAFSSGIVVPPEPGLVGRVFIAFDDGPLEPAPTWTCIDQGGSFPQSFVSGYDITSGRQTLLAQTDTGSATVYVNDHDSALFDPRNSSSPYFGKLDGRQILLQLYDPIAAAWRSQFRGIIDDYNYVMDGTAADENGDPINASIQIQCVDIFDYLAGYGLTPGIDGITPRTVPSGSAGGAVPAGMEDGVYYAETTGTNDDRIIEILADVGIDPTRYIVFSGNNTVQGVKYDPDESALIALRDACDAEMPFIANMYVDRFGRFVFHGRYGRFDPFGVSADAGAAVWDFHYWKLGDGKAIAADSTRTQIRVLEYSRARSEIVNVAVAYPANMPVGQMPSQVYADSTSIVDYGKHSAPPMSDLLVASAVFDSTANYPETFKFAELLVKNQKDPRESITAIQLKSIATSTPHAANVWSCLTESDVSDMVNVKVGYPDGTGFTGSSTADDYFIEGRQMTVRPSGSSYDYVELNLELSPYVWSSDTHSVFPPRT